MYVLALVVWLLWSLLGPSSASALGNDAAMPPPDIHQFNFKDVLSNFLGVPPDAPATPPAGCDGEDACRYGEMFTNFVVSGGAHAAAGTCTSATFATIAYSSAGNRLNQPAVAINYNTQGCNCANPGSATGWVIASGMSANTSGNFTRVGASRYFVDCTSGAAQPALPPDSAWLLKTGVVNGQITTVTQAPPRAGAAPTMALAIDPRAPKYGASCGDNVSAAQAAANRDAINRAIADADASLSGIRTVTFPCLFTVDQMIRITGRTHITLASPFHPAFFGPPTGGLRSTDTANPVIQVENNGSVQSQSIVLEGLTIQYSANAAANVCAVKYLNSNGAIKRMNITDAHIYNGICHIADNNGPAIEGYFLFVQDKTLVITARGSGLIATATPGRIMDLFLYDYISQSFGPAVDVGTNVITFIFHGDFTQPIGAVGGGAAIHAHGTLANPVPWLTMIGTYVESAECNAIDATYVNFLNIVGGEIEQAQDATCPAVLIGTGVNDGVISGVDFRQNAGGGIRLAGTSQNIQVTSNHFSGNPLYAVTIDAASVNNMVSGNLMVNSGAAPIIDNPGTTVIGPNSVVTALTPGLSVFAHGIQIDNTVTLANVGGNAYLTMNIVPNRYLEYVGGTDIMEWHIPTMHMIGTVLTVDSDIVSNGNYINNGSTGTTHTYTMCKTGACATTCTIISTGGIVTGGTC